MTATPQILNPTGSSIRNAAVAFGTGLFSVRRGTDQALTAGAFRLVEFDTVDYNEDGWYDTTTFKYTPKKPGYYLFTVSVYTGTVRSHAWDLSVFVNGSDARRISNADLNYGLSGSCICKLNGTTDYVQAKVYPYTSNVTLAATTYTNFFQGVLISAKD